MSTDIVTERYLRGVVHQTLRAVWDRFLPNPITDYIDQSTANHLFESLADSTRSLELLGIKLVHNSIRTYSGTRPAVVFYAEFYIHCSQELMCSYVGSPVVGVTDRLFEIRPGLE